MSACDTIPTYLDPGAEVVDFTHDPRTPAAWIVWVVQTLRTLGLTIVQAVWVTAHFALETGRGQRFRAYNLGGVKVKESWARHYREVHGQPAPWWRAQGNVRSGDPQCVFYRGYPSLRDFLTAWIPAYLPKPDWRAPDPGPPPHAGDYRRTGWRFWRDDPAWIDALIEAGYRGTVTAANPAPSIATHNRLVHEVAVTWAAWALGLPENADAATVRDRVHAFQRQAGLAVGEVDNATLRALAELHEPSALADRGIPDPRVVAPTRRTGSSLVAVVGVAVALSFARGRKRHRRRK